MRRAGAFFTRRHKQKPERFIAVFYTGLGAALLLAGLLFGRNFGKAVLAASQNVEEKGV